MVEALEEQQMLSNVYGNGYTPTQIRWPSGVMQLLGRPRVR
jgi:hypothetical protein